MTDLLFAVKRIEAQLKHLPGKHNQATHAGARGGETKGARKPEFSYPEFDVASLANLSSGMGSKRITKVLSSLGRAKLDAEDALAVNDMDLDTYAKVSAAIRSANEAVMDVVREGNAAIIASGQEHPWMNE